MLAPYSSPAGRGTPYRRAFTLVELLVVIAIIGVLVALLLPAVQAAREAANRTQCSNNMKQIGLAAHNFHDTYRRFPPGSLGDPVTAPTGMSGNQQHVGTLVYLLPYIEQTNIYDRIDAALDINIDHYPGITYAGSTKPIDMWCYVGGSWSAAQTKISAFECPSASPYDSTGLLAYSYTKGTTIYVASWSVPYETVGRTNYVSCAGGIGAGAGGWEIYKGMFYTRSKCKMASVTDGTSNTLMFGEALGRVDQTNKKTLLWGFPWMASGGLPTGWGLPKPHSAPEYYQNGSQHPGGVMFARGDASVTMVPSTVDTVAFYQTSGMGDGKVTSIFQQ